MRAGVLLFDFTDRCGVLLRARGADRLIALVFGREGGLEYDLFCTLLEDRCLTEGACLLGTVLFRTWLLDLRGVVTLEGVRSADRLLGVGR